MSTIGGVLVIKGVVADFFVETIVGAFGVIVFCVRLRPGRIKWVDSPRLFRDGVDAHSGMGGIQRGICFATGFMPNGFLFG